MLSTIVQMEEGVSLFDWKRVSNRDEKTISFFGSPNLIRNMCAHFAFIFISHFLKFPQKKLVDALEYIANETGKVPQIFKWIYQSCK